MVSESLLTIRDAANHDTDVERDTNDAEIEVEMRSVGQPRRSGRKSQATTSVTVDEECAVRDPDVVMGDADACETSHATGDVVDNATATLQTNSDVLWPAWLRPHKTNLEGIGSAEFQQVVIKLAAMDLHLGSPAGHVSAVFRGVCLPLTHALQSKTAMLSKQGRPEIIDRWVNGGRKSWPVVDDVPSFATAWRRWWISLQPEARVQRRSILVRTVDATETWEGLRKGSVNGFFNVVVSLAWWYEALKTPAQRKTFMDMLDDVLWVQDQILAIFDGGKKRTRSGGDVAEAQEHKSKR